MVGGIRLVALVSVVLIASIARAAPSCTEWMQQDDGSYWMECVNDDGSTHCYVSRPGDTVATEVTCQ